MRIRWPLVAAMVSAFIAVACHAPTAERPPRSVGTNPSWRGGTQEVTPAPSKDINYSALADAPLGATEYNAASRPPPGTTAVHREVAVRMAVIAASNKMSAPVQDGRLDAALTTLANALPQDGMLSNNVVDFALRRHGIVEPSPTLLILWGPVEDTTGLGAQIDASLVGMLKAGEAAAFGVGISPRGPIAAIVIGVMPVELSLEPVPRSLPSDGAFAMRGQLAPYLHTPEVVVTHDDGVIARYGSGKGTKFSTRVPCGGRVGKQQIEVTADGPTGATVVANFPVWCGEPAPTSMAPAAASTEPLYSNIDQAEAAMLLLVNADRRKAGLPPLAMDTRLVAIARAHSRDMKATGIVAHKSPTTGDASDRVKRAGVATATILENVARAVGVAEAQEALMNSPGHRANLMSPVATHIGIGIEFGDVIGGLREVYVTQVFILVPAKVEVSDIARRLERTLQDKKKLQPDAALTGVAQGLAKELAGGKTTKDAGALLDGMMKPLGARFVKVGSAITATADPSAIDATALVKEATGPLIGIGVAQGVHPDLGENTVWVVVLYGTLRN